MNLIRNIQFTLLIPINRQLREFNFRKRSDDLYDADTSDERGERYYFKMEVFDNNREWKIAAKDLPAWILEIEQLIAGALMEKEVTFK